MSQHLRRSSFMALALTTVLAAAASTSRRTMQVDGLLSAGRPQGLPSPPKKVRSRKKRRLFRP